MSDAVLFIGWKGPRAGHEEKALGWVMSEGVPYLKKLEGKYYERMDVFGLTAHGGDLNFAIVLHGNRAKLDELRNDGRHHGRRSADIERLLLDPG